MLNAHDKRARRYAWLWLLQLRKARYQKTGTGCGNRSYLNVKAISERANVRVRVGESGRLMKGLLAGAHGPGIVRGRQRASDQPVTPKPCAVVVSDCRIPDLVSTLEHRILVRTARGDSPSKVSAIPAGT